MKICYVFTNFHLVSFTGQPKIIYELARYSAGHGNDVSILSNALKRENMQRDGINIFLIPGLGDLNTYVFGVFNIIGQLKRIQPDIIHVHGYLITIFFWLVNKSIGVRMVCSTSETLAIIKNPLLRRIVIYCFSGAEKIFVSAAYIKNELVRSGIIAEKIEVVRIGLAQMAVNQKKPEALATDVLYFGDSTLARGFDIVSAVAKQLPQFTFTVLLRWQEKECAQTLVSLYGCVNVRVLHYPYSFPLVDYLLQAKIVLLPYRWMGVRPPLSLIESMKLGACVITSRLPGNEEVLEDGNNGVMLDAQDSSVITEKIKFLLANDAFRNQLAVKAEKTISEMYSTDEYAHIINALSCRIPRNSI